MISIFPLWTFHLHLYMRQHFSSTFMWSTYLPLYICIWGNISAAPSCGVHISHFTFVYETTFQQHLHVEYISSTLHLYMRQHSSNTFMWSTYLPLYICIWGNISAAPSCGVHISHFTFVYEVTFQQHLHVEYISPTLHLYMRQHSSNTFMWSTYLPLYICIWGNIPATPSCGVHISHFTFVYEVTFQQHLHVEYISPTLHLYMR